MIIDVHAHAYPARIAGKVKERMERIAGSSVESSGTPEALLEEMRQSGVDYSVFLPVATTVKQVGRLNAQAMHLAESYADRGWISFGTIHPDTPAPKKVILGIRNAGLRGIKLHPDYQGVYFDDIRYLRILEAASEQGLPVLVHAGMDEVYPDEVHCDVRRILRVLKEVDTRNMILAHMGGWQMWDDVKKDLCGAPVYFDTAFSLTGTVNVENRNGFGSMLDDKKFVEIVRSHGAQRVLFGSDTPWASQKESLNWIQDASLSGEEKDQILGENAAEILGIFC